MKWIKTAIGAVIAVLSIGIIATSVYKMTQPTNDIKEVIFEITNFEEDNQEAQFFPISAYDDILEYSVVIVNNYNVETVQNVTVYLDDEIGDIEVLVVNSKYIFVGDLPDLSGSLDFYITPDGYWYNDGGTLDYDAVVKLVFEVTQPPQLTGSVATLILLTPLICIGGFLIYLFRKQNY